MKNILALLVLVGIFRAGECAITAWSKPVIATAEGSETLVEKINDGVTTGDVTGITITATTTGTAAYTKVSQTPASPVLAIDSGTGVVTVTSGTVSYTSATTLTLVVSASDDSGANSFTATVTINVNAAPSFLSHSSTPCIRDGAITGVDLIDLRATDANTGTTITYAIASGDTNSDFDITTIPGVVQVASAKTLDMAITSSYTLVITAVDDSSTALTATTTVIATVSTTCPGCSGAAALAVSLMTILSALIISLQ